MILQYNNKTNIFTSHYEELYKLHALIKSMMDDVTDGDAKSLGLLAYLEEKARQCLGGIPLVLHHNLAEEIGMVDDLHTA